MTSSNSSSNSKQIMPNSIDLQAFYDVSVNDNDIHKKCKTIDFSKEKNIDHKYDITLELLKTYEDINKQINNQEVSNFISLYLDPYKDKRKKKCDDYLKHNWYTWLYQLLNGYNLIFYGIGSKYQIIKEFIDKNLNLETIIVIEGNNNVSIPDEIPNNFNSNSNVDTNEEEEQEINIVEVDIIYQILNQICTTYIYPNSNNNSKSHSQLANEYMHMLCGTSGSVSVDTYCKAIIGRLY